MDAAQAKLAARRRARAARRQMSAAERASASAAICARLAKLDVLRGAAPLAAYWARWDEPDIGKFVLTAAKNGRSVCLPRCAGPQGAFALHQMPQSAWQLTTGYGGILEPSLMQASFAANKIAAAIVPATSVARSGARAGSGRGLYDITFRAMPDIVFVSPVFSCQLAAALPLEPHDIRLDLIVTERETIEVAP